MKLQILSDLHIDSYARRGLPLGKIPATDCDVILVAGDTANADKGMAWLSEQAEQLGKPIVTIAGNHEYFGQDVLSFDATLAGYDSFDIDPVSQSMSGLKLLQCQSLDIEHAGHAYRLLGCTLWTDYCYNATANTRKLAMQFMRDYQQIYAGQDLFTPEQSVALHHAQRSWLKSALQQAYREYKTAIVMTHHSVSPLSVSDKYADFESNAAFVTDLSAWMSQDFSPALWVHGHTHEAFDYQLGNTRVIANPRAYPGEVSSTKLCFAWDKVVSVSPMF